MADTSEAQKHYESLTSAFKYLVTLIGVLIIAASYLIETNFSKANNDIKELKAESAQSLKENKAEADKQLEDLRKRTELYLTLTKDLTAMQVTATKIEAKELALASARERVEETFRANNIQDLIDASAKKEIGNRVELLVGKEIDKATKDLGDIAVLVSLCDRVRNDDREALDNLDSMANYSVNPRIKEMAKYLLYRKGLDYEAALETMRRMLGPDINTPGGDRTLLLEAYGIGLEDSLFIQTPDTSIARTIITGIILKDRVLNRVASAFIILRKYFHINVNTFDINFVRQLK